MSDHLRQGTITGEHLKPSSTMELNHLVHQFQLLPHPEGGWYREVHRSSIQVKRADGETRSALTTVLFLLGADEVSRWHRVIGADETWNHLQGSALTLFKLADSKARPESLRLASDSPVQTIPAGSWMAARSEGDFTLMSCCVGPGFDFRDFEMLADQPVETWPEGVLKALI
ncbi:MAG: cupin domain-containing protein [Prochlorococcus sp.]